MTGPGSLRAGEIDVRGLRVSTSRGGHTLVAGVSLTAGHGESIGIVGESGSGKSLTLRSLLGQLPRGVRMTADRMRIGGRVGMVFQDPMTALDPMASVGSQIAEAARYGGGASRAQAKRMSLELMTDVGLPDPARRLRWYPHQLSGGQRQRVVIAMALAVKPDILLCDEPTTALDVTVQARLLRLLDEERRRRGMTIVFVSHNLAVVQQMCQRMIVLHHGHVVESGSSHAIVHAPRSSYTQRLLASILSVDTPQPAAATFGGQGGEHDPGHHGGIAVHALTVSFTGVTALRKVSFAVPPGGVLGIVGESGSGKSTLARAIAGMQRVDAGSVLLDGRPLPRRRSAVQRRDIQLMPQDPYSSLNPRMTVRQVIAELLCHVNGLTGPAVDRRAEKLMRTVQLEPDLLDAYPQQCSGGQRQRIALARALAVEPRVLLLDEPTSALDSTVQRDIVMLLRRLRADLGVTMLFISHDLGVVRALCDDILVMRAGTVVEHAPSSQFFAHPGDPYSQELLDSVPHLER